jgi:hypothetical protein
MAKIDELLSKVMEAQHELTYVVECTDFQNHHPAITEARKKRNSIVDEIRIYVIGLENEHGNLKKQLADLTPHLDDVGYESDYDDHSRGW